MPPSDDKKPKPKCPECETEIVLTNDEMPDECGKCGMMLKGFPQFIRWLSAWEKMKAQKKPASKKTGNPLADFFSLGG